MEFYQADPTLKNYWRMAYYDLSFIVLNFKANSIKDT